MTLDRLIVAWVVVVLWFAVATFLTGAVARSMAPPAEGATLARDRALPWRLIEAALLTLIASLWFDSLGSGDSWLLFLLIGALVAFPAWFRPRPADVPARVLVINTVADLARYAVAGALLAWRLS